MLESLEGLDNINMLNDLNDLDMPDDLDMAMAMVVVMPTTWVSTMGNFLQSIFGKGVQDVVCHEVIKILVFVWKTSELQVRDVALELCGLGLHLFFLQFCRGFLRTDLLETTGVPNTQDGMCLFWC